MPCASSPGAGTTGATAIPIAVTAALLSARSFTLDGEAVVCGPDGVAIFDALHRRGTVSEDLLELDGEDVRGLPSGDRKKRMARLLAGRRVGIVLSEHTADDGATIFRQACRMNLEGIVSKRLSAPYLSGPSRDWLKVKKTETRGCVALAEPHPLPFSGGTHGTTDTKPLQLLGFFRLGAPFVPAARRRDIGQIGANQLKFLSFFVT
jgi:hypothetical protein